MTDYLINYRRTRRPGYVAGIQPPTPPGIYPTANLNFHIKADSLALSDGDKVASWTELIVGNHPVQDTESQKPTFKVSIINGLPIVRFNATDSTCLYAPNKVITIPAESSYYSVVNIGSSVSGPIFKDNMTNRGIGFGVGSSTLENNGNNIVGAYYGVNWINSSVVYGLSPVLVSFHTNADTTLLTVYKNGNLIYSPTLDSAQGGTSGFGIGCDDWPRYLTGDIAEVMVYSVLHDTTTRQQVEAYLNSKYALW